MLSLLARVTVTPPAGAGAPNKVIGNRTDWPSGTFTLAGSPMVGTEVPVTVTVAVAPVTVGALLVAVMVAVPAATPVTGTGTLAAPAGIVTVDGTEATAGLLEFRLPVNPPGGPAAD